LWHVTCTGYDDPCPASEVRDTRQQALVRTSEAKGHWQAYEFWCRFSISSWLSLLQMLQELQIGGTSPQ
jgi:hypothetical protein